MEPGPPPLHSGTLPPTFKERIRSFRDSRGMSREALAAELGVTPITLYRWETGSTRPSPLAAEKLRALGFGAISNNETNATSVPRLRAHGQGSRSLTEATKLRESGRLLLQTPSGALSIIPAPFVRNGPADQTDFHQKLLNLQTATTTFSPRRLTGRLSLVEEVDGFGETAQHSLESPRSVAVSWNSNYGTHGWHRYVGRFPPHVIRALLNHFNADSNTVVCDPFAGSGTTAVECRLMGIPFVGIEICPLSCLMTRTKAAFPDEAHNLVDLSRSFRAFYEDRWDAHSGGERISDMSHDHVLRRNGNLIPSFRNMEQWFTPEALLGTSIAVEFGMSLSGFARDASLLALSSKMRSIGNVDVDVVRAEYSKQPRKGVDVSRLVVRQLSKMATDISSCLASHSGLIGRPSSIQLHEGSALDVDLPEESIDHVITSPPYGVEAISYLRTHLLSYRSLVAYLGHDPYDTRDKTIGSEYLVNTAKRTSHQATRTSAVCKTFFSSIKPGSDSKFESRRAAMLQFCDDMLAVGERLSRWLKDGGKVAFVIGNKRLGNDVIPMDAIVSELFRACDLLHLESVRHKLKTNNSNSQVPWQERIIQEESIMLFERARRRK